MPESIGIIMDGNRRWARAQGLPSFAGHQAGYKKLKEVVRWAKAAGVRTLTAYAFSTENWKRTPEEIGYLFDLFKHAFSDGIAELAEEGTRLQFIGERERFPEELQALMRKAEEDTKDAGECTLVIALSYGGRAEILAAVNALLARGAASVSEEEFRTALWSGGLRDPDLIIRTGGEMRLSNFLTWSSVYSELMFTDTPWPALTKEEFLGMLAAFEARERRVGK